MSSKTERKQLLIYAHYYIPDAASTGQLLGELAEGLLDKFDITVICAVPSYSGFIQQKYKRKRYYEENIKGVNILRIRVPEFIKKNKFSRIKNILSYLFGAMLATFKIDTVDYVLAISQPPILGGLIGVWGKKIKHAKLIYNIQDFNPEQIMRTGYSSNKVVLSVMMFLDKFSCKQSDLIITVGRDLLNTVQERFKGEKVPTTIMINNWINEKKVYPLKMSHPKVKAFRKRYGLMDKLVIMYSGNIGLYYDLENIMKVIKSFKPGTRTHDGREVVFAFVGDGALRDKLISYVRSHHMDNVIFIPYQKKENLLYSLNAGDIHMVVNARGMKGVSCPSKYYGCAAVQAPILGVLEKGSEIRCIIEEAKGGLCSEPGDYKALKENITKFIKYSCDDEMKKMGLRNYKSLITNYQMDMSIMKYEDAIFNL